MKSERRGLTKDGARSLRLLLMHLAVCAAGALAATIWIGSGVGIPTCMIYEVLGVCCLTCGSTRAAYELVRGRFLSSLLLNPVPLMLAVWLLGVMLCELVGALRGRRVRIKGALACLIATLAAAAVYCALRNIGVAPKPDEVFIRPV